MIGVIAMVAGGWWWRGRAEEPSASRTTKPQLRGAGASVATRGSEPEPARIVVTVTDERGPICDASVRLAPERGEIIVLQTGGDGVARAEDLEPGSWQASASARGHVPAASQTTELRAGIVTPLTIRLSTGGQTLRGTVSDVTGGPVAGARIDAARIDQLGRPGDAVATTLSGVDGAYQLSVVQGALHVAVASADYAPQGRTVDVDSDGAVADFALVPGGVIEGVVRDAASQQPIAGARVSARRDSSGLFGDSRARVTSSGADGRFRLSGLAPGAWTMAATAGRRSSRAPKIVGIGVAEQVGDVELAIGEGPIIRGTVVDETGAPAGHAELFARAAGHGEEATADAAGAFVFTGLPVGDYEVSARGPSYLRGEPTPVALIRQDVEHVVVHVQRAAVIRGHVEPRQPCEVQVAWNPRGGMRGPSPRVSTAADGELKLGPVSDGAAELIARCTSGDHGALPITITRGMAEVIVPVAAGASIAGRVVDSDGKPVAGIGVIANDVTHGASTTITNGRITSGAQTLSDAAGAYVLGGLAPGTYQLDALDQGAPVRLRIARPPFALAAREHKAGVDLAIDRANGTITGTVTGPDGRPLAGAWVSVQRDVMAMMYERGSESGVFTISQDSSGLDAGVAPVLSDAQGRYEHRGLPRAIYTVTAEAERGQLRTRADRIKPDATVDLKLRRVAMLSGTVSGAAGPSALFSVEINAESAFDRRSFTDGAFSFGRVDAGTYKVTVEAAEGEGEATVSVQPGAPATVAITLAARAVVIGTLVDAAGKPLAGRMVTLSPDQGQEPLGFVLNRAPPTSGPDGRFRVEHRAERCGLVVLNRNDMFTRPFERRGLALEAGKTLDLGVVTVTTPPAKP